MENKIKQKIFKTLPAVAFLVGFVWDSLTLGRMVQSSDLWILSGYWLGAFLVLVLLGRNPPEKWQRILTWLTQFFFGSLFSAMVVCYFKSSGTLFTFLFVLLLAGLLLVNEFIQDRYSRLGVSWSIFCLSGTMYLNFLVPHLFHSIHAIWFLVSVMLGFLLVYVLWRLSRKPIRDLLAPGMVSIGILGFWLFDLIPPVPLVMKQNIVCKNFERMQGDYTCLAPEATFLELLGVMDPEIFQQGNEKIFVLSSVFAPSEVSADLEHRWQWLNEASGQWTLSGTTRMSMKGGRASGFRLYSYRTFMQPGYWRVETAVQNGAVVGYIEFKVPGSLEDEGTQYERRRLD